MRFFCHLVTAMLMVVSTSSMAAIEAVTDDGERVRLLDDFTWEYIEDLSDEEIDPELTLEVTHTKDLHGNCQIGLILRNNARYKIISLVPQFRALLAGDIDFENIFVGFQDIKPTLNQYQLLEFHHVACADIKHVLVHGGDRCNMDDLTKYSPDKGECLRRVRVIPSQFINISE